MQDNVMHLSDVSRETCFLILRLVCLSVAKTSGKQSD